MQSLRRVLHIAAWMLAAALFAGPAVAWDLHELGHASAPVTASEHHHHDADGSVDMSHHATPDADHDRDKDGGHDHLPSVSAAWSLLMGSAPLLPDALPAQVVHYAATGDPPPSLDSEPQIRPPRAC